MNHYDTLNIARTASQAEIKQAYRRLVKRFHPDSNREIVNHEQIRQVNAAYEVLGDPDRRQRYDQQLQLIEVPLGYSDFQRSTVWQSRQQRTVNVQNRYRQQRQTARQTDEQLQRWLQQIYWPINALLESIHFSLEAQIDELSADPFDDALMAVFQDYLDDCRNALSLAQSSFRSMPNPPAVAGVAAHLYYCMNQTSDGLEELGRFVLSYDDYSLHTGQELFRIADGLRQEAHVAVRHLVR